MKFAFPLIAAVILLTACDQSAKTTSAQSVDIEPNEAVLVNSPDSKSDALENFVLKDIPNSDIQMASLEDVSGITVESGGMLNGHKTGTWITNHIGTEYPAKVVSFVNGMHNGVYLEINKNGQIELMAYYKNNKLHGPWAKMRFGKAEMSVNYVDGQKDGVYAEFDFRNGRIKKEVTYKNGIEDGVMRNYDDEGNVIVEYMFRDGEKISGGIVK